MNADRFETPFPTYRSPLLMNHSDTAIIVIDVQEKLVPHIANHHSILWNIGRIIDGANELGIPIGITEQYSKGLGSTVPAIRGKFAVLDSANMDSANIFEKSMFSCRECQALTELLIARQIHNVLVIGMETHVCILQSALDMMANGFEVFIAVDAVGSRFEIDHETALRRLESSGATLVTTEMALFEWCEVSGTDKFKKISQIVRDPFDKRGQTM